MLSVIPKFRTVTLKEAIPEALEAAYGIPKQKAADIVETQPIWWVRGLLRDLGFSYRHEVKRWEKVIA